MRRALLGLIDAAVLPDMMVGMESFPRAGRGNKLDRAALAARVLELLA